MLDPIESAIERLTAHYLNHSDELFASEVVSLAIKLSSSTKKNDIIPNIDLALELIENAKKIISTKKMETKVRH